MEHIRFVGLDIHKERISIAVAESGRSTYLEGMARPSRCNPLESWLVLGEKERVGGHRHHWN